jgi:cytochrome c oxidase assembly protein subunit 15
MMHRITAFLILGLVVTCWLKARPYAAVRKLTDAWLALILLQAVLGVVTVLKNKPADIATAHVVVGAASLALGALISIMLARLAQQRSPEPAPALKPAFAESHG